MAEDPGVTSVRVAVALCDRFEELLKGPTSVTAAKTNRALIGVSGNETELSLRIGEANQIYPEIWRHLDDARNVFAGRGAQVAGYDTLRAAEGAGIGANVQTSYAQVAGPHGHERTTKDANFNRAGLVRARMACNALMQANPHVNWAAIAAAEANDPAAAAFRSATVRKRIIMFGALALLLASPFLYVMWRHHEDRVKMERYRAQYEPRTYKPIPPPPSLPAADAAALKQRVLELRVGYELAVTNWEAATADAALRALKPGTEPCSKQVTAPTPTAAESYVETNDIDDAAFKPSDFRGYVAGQGTIPVDPITGTQDQIVRMSERLATSEPTAADKAKVERSFPSEYIFVMIDKDIEPEVTSTAPIDYTPGEVIGRAYVYSLLQGKIVCAAAIDAKSVPSKPLPKFLANARRAREASDALHRQLEIAIREELATKLRAVAP